MRKNEVFNRDRLIDREWVDSSGQEVGGKALS